MEAQDRQSTQQEVNEAIYIEIRMMELTKHPYFPEIKDLPAWQEALAELEEVR